MPQAVAPPRSTVSAKFARTARYSAAAEGPNKGDSGTCPSTRPSTSRLSMPASASASAASSAEASSANMGRSQTRCGAHSASPAMAAALRPTLGEGRQHVAAHQLDRLHHLLVSDLVGVHEAEQEVGARLRVLLAALDHLGRVARD